MKVIQALLWENKDSSSLEYFNLIAKENAFVLEGTIVMLLDGSPTRITYKIECDKNWKTRDVAIRQERSGITSHLALKVSNRQIWKTKGSTIPFATGLHDVDLEVTPATNTLPIRRIGLKEGESRQVDAVWVRFPSLALERLQQRYTRIGRNRYRYEYRSVGYQAELEVDESGLVVSYGNLWSRVAGK
ncbi:MAG: putative glycolipid-binding domain-containing protein [Nitrososphaera sp.]